MARLPRLNLPGHFFLLSQTGSGAQKVFRDDTDVDFFLTLLADCSQNRRVAVHGYRLTTGGMHLLVTPAEADAASAFMQDIGRRYVRWVNTRYRRLGSLWAGRFRSVLVQPGAMVLASMVYLDREEKSDSLDLAIDETVLRTSAAHYTGHRVSRFLVSPAAYWELGDTPFTREATYARLVRQGLDAPLKERIAQAARSGWVLADPDYVRTLQESTNRRLTKGKAGRPRKVQQAAEPSNGTN